MTFTFTLYTVLSLQIKRLLSMRKILILKYNYIREYVGVLIYFCNFSPLLLNMHNYFCINGRTNYLHVETEAPNIQQALKQDC